MHRLVRIAILFICVISATTGGHHLVLAQDADTGAPADSATVDQEPTPTPVVEWAMPAQPTLGTPASGSEEETPSRPAVDAPESAVQGAHLSQKAVPSATSAETPVTQTAPEIQIASGDGLFCEVYESEDSTLEAGSTIDYACTHQITFSATQIDPGTLVVDWSTNVSAAESLFAQLLLPDANSPQWTPDGQRTAVGNTLSAPQPAGDPQTYPSAIYLGSQTYTIVEEGSYSISLRFLVRLTRGACSEPAGQTSVSVAATISASGVEGASARSSPVLAQTTLAPNTPAPDIQLPIATIGDMQIDTVSFSLYDQYVSGHLEVGVAIPASQCQPSSVILAVETSIGAAVIVRRAESTGGEPMLAVLSSEKLVGSDLRTATQIAVIASGAASNTLTLSITFDLLVPANLVAGRYSLTPTVEVI